MASTPAPAQHTNKQSTEVPMNVTLSRLGWWSTRHISVFSLAIALGLLLVFPREVGQTGG